MNYAATLRTTLLLLDLLHGIEIKCWKHARVQQSQQMKSDRINYLLITFIKVYVR